MSNNGISKETTKLVSKTKKAVDEFGSAIDATSTALEAFNKFSDAAKKLSKLSSGLGALGTALGMIQFLSGQQSDTAQILSAISRVSQQVDALDGRMQDRFDQLTAVVKEAAVKTTLNPQIAMLRTVKDLMENYVRHADKGGDDPDFQNALMALSHFSTMNVVLPSTIIDLSLNGKGISYNLFEVTYEVSDGGMREIAEICGSVILWLSFAKTAHVFLNTLADARNGEPTRQQLEANQRAADDFFDDKIANATKNLKVWLDKCEDEMSFNVKPKLRKILYSGQSRGLDHKAMVSKVRKELSEHFFWCDWLAIVYDPISGYSNHSMTGWNYKAIFREYGVNTVVKWVPKTHAAVGGKTSTLHRYQDTRGRAPSAGRTVTVRLEDTTWGDEKSELPALGRWLTPPLSYPGLVWRCKRYKGVYGSWTNSKRCKWVNGTEVTLCVFH